MSTRGSRWMKCFIATGLLTIGSSALSQPVQPQVQSQSQFEDRPQVRSRDSLDTYLFNLSQVPRHSLNRLNLARLSAQALPAKSAPSVQKLPENGAVIRHGNSGLNSPFQTTLAPLKIHTQGPKHHFVKLVDANSNQAILTIFVRSGKTASAEVPIGKYKVRYATGTQWYGEKNLFGSETRYAEADKTLDFHVEGNQIQGYQLYLYSRPNGNLPTKKIAPNQF